jgi:hypothetical protein
MYIYILYVYIYIHIIHIYLKIYIYGHLWDILGISHFRNGGFFDFHCDIPYIYMASLGGKKTMEKTRKTSGILNEQRCN